MANNRMFLVYRPTGEAVFLGKRMGWGWYGTPDNVAEQIMILFDRAEDAAGEFSQDDFALALESAGNQPHCLDNWNYSKQTVERGILKLEIDPNVPYGTSEKV